MATSEEWAERVGRWERSKVEGDQAELTPVRFPGQYADEETGLYFNRYRYYDSETGQYLSPEPIRLEGSLRVYAYVDGWPLELSDHDGLAKMHTEVTGAYLKKNGKRSNVTKHGHSGMAGSTDLHPAVEAALALTSARPSGNGGAQNVCSEPKALSDYLKQWELDTLTGPDYDPSWIPNANRAQSSTREGPYLDKEGKAVDPGAWNWDGNRWTKL
ncbi:RHS repeat-associated core domain-containing protein [Sorangium sp. So ce327]|uniref:RHS repeat-associated core domain-containing protein n=1 Tax=Sorangium sp. So ce327 TaxID=3133301 RepID=UPI003F6002C8